MIIFALFLQGHSTALEIHLCNTSQLYNFKMRLSIETCLHLMYVDMHKDY